MAPACVELSPELATPRTSVCGLTSAERATSLLSSRVLFVCTGLKPAALCVIGTRGVPGVVGKSDIGFQNVKTLLEKYRSEPYWLRKDFI